MARCKAAIARHVKLVELSAESSVNAVDFLPIKVDSKAMMPPAKQSPANAMRRKSFGDTLDSLSAAEALSTHDARNTLEPLILLANAYKRFRACSRCDPPGTAFFQGSFVSFIVKRDFSVWAAFHNADNSNTEIA